MTFLKSLSRFEIDMCGCNKKSNAASFYVCFAMVIPLISGMDLILFSRGSRVRTNNNVEGPPLSSTIVDIEGVRQVTIHANSGNR